MQFKGVIYALLVCICSGNAMMDPVQMAVSSEVSNLLSLETTALEPTTRSNTTAEPTTRSNTTAEPTTPSNTTPSTTTAEPTTPSTTTAEPTTPSMTTAEPTTVETTISSTTIPPATTQKPNPPHPTGMNWVVVDEVTNITCIVVKLSATAVIPYPTMNGNVENATIAMPGNATSNGTCNPDLFDKQNTQKISLQWTFGQSVIPNVLTFVFQKNASSGNDSSTEEWVFLSDITLQIYLDSTNFPNATGEFVYAEQLNSYLHPVPVNNSYRCNSQEDIEMHIKELGSPATVRMAHLQMEAFRTSVSDKFSSASDCPADKVVTSDIVPIAVGCALAALVVIVLVAYLIGRRRARQRGYQSV